MNSKGIAAIALIIGVISGFTIGWFAPALIPAPPRVSLLDQIKANNVLIVGTDVPWPPFEIYNTTTSQYEGFDIDLCQLIADDLGVNLEVQDIDFDLLVEACKQGTVHMLAAAMFITSERAEELAFSVPYIRTNEVVVVKGVSTLTISSLEDLAGHSVGVQEGTVEDLEIQDLIDAGHAITRVPYAKADVLMAALDAGTVEAAYVDEPVFTHFASIYDIKIIYTVPAPPMAFYCKWEEPELLDAINTVLLDAYWDGTMDDLIAKWFG